MVIELPSQEELLELFKYDPDTGELWHRTRKRERFKKEHHWKAWNTRFAGKKAGHLSPSGYIRTKLDGRLLNTHRVIFKIVTGRDPENYIDHLNGDKTDNRFENLRDVEPSENNKNCYIQANNTSGFNGVNFYTPLQKWCASGRLNKKRIHLGYFDTPEEAHCARHAWDIEQGYSERHGEQLNSRSIGDF